MPASPDPAFEQLVRERLSLLADQAPTSVLGLDEVRVEHDRRRDAGRHAPTRRRRVAGVGATVAALVGAVGITTVALSGAGTAGAATPEEAVAAFVEATQSEDLLGMIDALDPFEVPAARAAAETGRADAVEAELVGEGFRLDGVEGLDVSFADLAYTTEAVGEGVAVVSIDGSVTGVFDPDRFPLGSVLQEVAGDDVSLWQRTRTLGDVSPEVMLATVERDGRWFVSASYTLAEYVRRETDLPVPSTAVEATGFPTPEEAARAFHTGLLRLDLDRVVALAAPGEGDAMLRYGPALVAAGADGLELLRSEGPVLSLDEVTFDMTGSGSRRRAVASTYTVTGTVPEPQMYGFYDPSLPTVVSDFEGSGIVVLEPGVPLPETLDGFVLDDTFAFPEGEVNSTWADEEGRVTPLPELPVRTGPQEVTIRRADGCVIVTGEGAVTVATGGFIGPGDASGTVHGTLDGALDDTVEAGSPMPFTASTLPGYEAVEGGWRSCDGPDSLFGLLPLFGVTGVSLLPLELVEVDGQWFVSPVGTLASVVLDLLRTVRDDGLLDSPLALPLLGVDRSLLEGYLIGQDVDGLPPVCREVVVAADGSAGGPVGGVADDPDLGAVRDCWNALVAGFGTVETVETVENVENVENVETGTVENVATTEATTVAETIPVP